jgi:hypothetical protein
MPRLDKTSEIRTMEIVIEVMACAQPVRKGSSEMRDEGLIIDTIGIDPGACEKKTCACGSFCVLGVEGSYQSLPQE